MPSWRSAVAHAALAAWACGSASASDLLQPCLADRQTEGAQEACLATAPCLRRPPSLMQASQRLHGAMRRMDPVVTGSSSWAVSPDPPAGAVPKVFVGLKSAPGNLDRRSKWRASDCSQRLLGAGFNYKFIIGVPMDQGHVLTDHLQGTLDTANERSVSQRLLEESDRHKDILVIPERDQYQDLSNKLLQLLRHGYSDAGADYVVEADDEYCVQPQPVLATIAKHQADGNATDLWAGSILFNGTEYRNMKGPHGEVAEFFSGHGSVLSRGLVKLIVEDDRTHSVLSAFYGSESDDANMGKWVKYAKEVHGITVDVLTIPDMLSTTSPDDALL